jgi:hypothetical protein
MKRAKRPHRWYRVLPGQRWYAGPHRFRMLAVPGSILVRREGR